MDYSSTDTTNFHSFSSSPSTSPTSSSTTSFPPPPPPPPPHHVVLSPCAACKILRRRCAEKCVLAPYFPPTEPLKFTTAHRVFGASNIIKLLQELPESKRADAVSSMVYEANARIRDPVYGCAGAICQLQKQADELQAQLARAQAELLNLQAQHANLIALICVEMAQANQPPPCAPEIFHGIHGAGYGFDQNDDDDDVLFFDQLSSHGSFWEEPLWI